MKVEGSFALVTGASSGIGRATAIALAKVGARQLAVVGRNGDELAKTVMECALYCPSGGYCLDLSRPEQVHELAIQVLTNFGTPSIIVNAAGAGRFVALDESSMDEAVDALEIPFFAALAMVHTFLPDMIRRGSGRIVNITSPAAIAPWAGATAYAASRWAVRGFTYALQQDLAGTGVGATLVIPGKTATAYFENNPGAEERIPKISRLVRTLQPFEVGQAIVHAIERDKDEVILPGMLRAFALMHRFFPGTVQYLIRRTGWQRP